MTPASAPPSAAGAACSRSRSTTPGRTTGRSSLSCGPFPGHGSPSRPTEVDVSLALPGLLRARERLGRYPVRHRLWGWWVARRFTRAGWLACTPGFPKVRVRNLGGVLEAGNCVFFPGVRLEVGKGGRLSIGTGTYLN